MSEGLIYDQDKFTIPANGMLQRSPPSAKYMRVLQGNLLLSMQINHRAKTDIFPGIGIYLPDFDVATKINFFNGASNSVEVIVAYSDQPIDDQRLTTTSVINVTGGTNIKTYAAQTIGTTAVSVLATNGNRTEAQIQNNSTSGQNIYIGDSDVDASANRGTKVVPGATYFCNTGAELYAEADGAGATLTITELTV